MRIQTTNMYLLYTSALEGTIEDLTILYFKVALSQLYTANQLGLYFQFRRGHTFYQLSYTLPLKLRLSVFKARNYLQLKA